MTNKSVQNAAIELLSHLKLYVLDQLPDGDALRDHMYDLTAALSASPSPPPSAGVDAVAGLTRADICRLWQWAAVNKPSSMTVEGFTDLLLNEIDGRSDPAKVQSITNQYLDILHFADNCLSSNGLFAQAKQLRERIAALTPAPTPVSEVELERLRAAERELHATVRKLNCDNAEQFWKNIDRLRSQALAKPAPAAEAVREAAQAVLDSRCSTYTARNGRKMGIQDDSGEMMWIVPFDEMHALEAALAPAAQAGTVAQEGRDND